MDKFVNSTYALHHLLQKVVKDGEEVIIKGSKTKEVIGEGFTILAPAERIYVMPHRADNIFHKIAESLWVVSGLNDAKWLTGYLPHALNWSDDGVTWRAAYGERLRRYPYSNSQFHDFKPVTTDQIKNVLHTLKKDRQSRQAVAMIWHPDDLLVDTKDVPCNNWLQFIIRPFWSVVNDVESVMIPEEPFERQDMLHLSVAQRSSDLIWGFSGINTFEWSVLQMMMAHWLDCRIGSLNYFITSLHLYETHFEKANRMLEGFKHSTVYDYGVMPADGFSTDFEDFDTVMMDFWMWEQEMRWMPHTAGVRAYGITDPYLVQCADMLQFYKAHEAGSPVNILRGILERMPNNDYKLAAVEWYGRKHPEVNCWEVLDICEDLHIAYANTMGNGL